MFIPRSDPPLLRAAGLRLRFGGHRVLDGVDLELAPGEVALLRGENGSGKTTLLNVLSGFLPPEAGEIEYRSAGPPCGFRFPQRWWPPPRRFVPEQIARLGVRRTWQDVRLFDTQSLRDNVAVAADNHPGENPAWVLLRPGRVGREEAAVQARAAAALDRVGLGGYLSASADRVSLGQSKRAAIARAAHGGAKVLLLDEPLAGLDAAGVEAVVDCLRELVRDRSLALVVVEHAFNHPALRRLVTTDWLLDAGKLHRSPGGPATGAETPPPVPEWFGLLTGGGADVRSERLPRGAVLTRIRRRVPDRPTPVLELRGLVVRRGARAVVGLDDDGREVGLDLLISDGELAVLQAPNGWGKSSLIGAVAGLLPAAGGTVRLAGRPLDGLAAWVRARRGLRTVPATSATFPHLTLDEARRLAGVADLSAALAAAAGRPVGSLSGGQKQLLALHLAGQDPRSAAVLQVFDEPFAALDQAATATAVRALVSRGVPATLIAVPTLRTATAPEPGP